MSCEPHVGDECSVDLSGPSSFEEPAKRHAAATVSERIHIFERPSTPPSQFRSVSERNKAPSSRRSSVSSASGVDVESVQEMSSVEPVPSSSSGRVLTGPALSAELKRLREPLFGASQQAKQAASTDSVDIGAIFPALDKISDDLHIVLQEVESVSVAMRIAHLMAKMQATFRDHALAVTKRLQTNVGQDDRDAEVAWPKLVAKPKPGRQQQQMQKQQVQQGQQQKQQKQSQQHQQQQQQPVNVPQTWAVLVKSSVAGATAEEVKAKVLRDIPSTMPHMVIEGVRRHKGVGVIMETHSQAMHEQLLASAAFASSGLVVADAPKPGRLVLIPKVPASVTSEDLLTELIARNCDPEVQVEATELSVRSRGAGENGNVILNVGDSLMKQWKGRTNLKIGFQVFSMRVLSGVELCFKCTGHGHVAAQCKSAEALCRRCGEAGHMVAMCQNPESCRNCKLLNKAHDHAVNSTKCPIYSRALERLTLRRQRQE